MPTADRSEGQRYMEQIKELNMANKISVITVVYNDVANIRKTMESFFSQTWEDKELIVIDGGSTDG
ncbi:glycosyltransferase, partial [Prevotella sp.]|uniref:glycosyltransferase n=1 Tax=Prevotella sp. TaxID=59823 RepID=UPI003FD8F221